MIESPFICTMHVVMSLANTRTKQPLPRQIYYSVVVYVFMLYLPGDPPYIHLCADVCSVVFFFLVVFCSITKQMLISLPVCAIIFFNVLCHHSLLFLNILQGSKRILRSGEIPLNLENCETPLDISFSMQVGSDSVCIYSGYAEQNGFVSRCSELSTSNVDIKMYTVLLSRYDNSQFSRNGLRLCHNLCSTPLYY